MAFLTIKGRFVYFIVSDTLDAYKQGSFLLAQDIFFHLSLVVYHIYTSSETCCKMFTQFLLLSPNQVNHLSLRQQLTKFLSVILIGVNQSLPVRSLRL